MTSDDPTVTPIGDAVSSLLRSRGLGSTVVLAEVMAKWEQVAGAELAAKIRPVALQGRRLVCEVDEPAWATQVRLLADKLLGRLAEELGRDVADELSVRVKRRSEA